jgi:hypothetical protein
MKVHKRTTLRAESTPSSASRYSPARPLSSHARPLPDLRDAHTPVRLPAHRDPVQPRSRVQAGAESVAAPLVGADAPNIKGADLLSAGERGRRPSGKKLIAEISHEPETHINEPNRRFLESREMRCMSVS